MMERRFLPTLCFSNFVNFFFFSWETWFVVHVVFCLKLCYLNSKMALIKYEFHNTTSVCLKIRMTEYIVYECFHRYVKSKFYYQIVAVCFLRKKLMPTVSSGRSLILKVIIIAHNQRDKNCAILCQEGEKAPNL